jgi:hypothetical protein
MVDKPLCRVESLNVADGGLANGPNLGKPTNPNNIGGITAQDGASAKSEMGEGSEGIAANGASENNGPGSCEAHDVSSSSQEDRGVSAGEMGEGETGEEGGVATVSHQMGKM